MSAQEQSRSLASTLRVVETADADPRFLAKLAWSIRWSDRKRSVAQAYDALKVIEAAPHFDRKTYAACLRTLAWQAKWRGDLSDAMELSERALPHLEATGSWAEMADVLSILGVVHYSQSRIRACREAVARGEACLSRLGPDEAVVSRVDLLATESSMLRYIGRVEDALERLEAALDLAEGAEISRVLQNIARFYLHFRDTETAVLFAMRSSVSARRWDNRVVQPYALEVLGATRTLQGRHDEACAALREGLAIAREDDDQRVTCQLLRCAGSLALAKGEPKRALRLLQEGASVAREMDYPLWQRNFAEDMATAHEADGDLAAALDAMKTLCRLERELKG